MKQHSTVTCSLSRPLYKRTSEKASSAIYNICSAKDHKYILLEAIKKERIQVNGKIFEESKENKLRYLVYITLCVCAHCCTTRTVVVSWNADTHPSHCLTWKQFDPLMPISIHLQCTFA